MSTSPTTKPIDLAAMRQAAETVFVETLRQHAYHLSPVPSRAMVSICTCGHEVPSSVRDKKALWAEHVAEVLGVIHPWDMD